MSEISFAARVKAPDDVMVRELQGESVLLNLASSQYYGLDPVGTDMWQALTGSESIQAAYERLLSEYEVEPETLRHDLAKLIEDLVAQGLLQVED